MTLLDLVTYFSAFAIADDVLQHNPVSDRESSFVVSDTEENSVDEIIKKSNREFVLVLMPYDKKMLPVKDGSQYWGKNVCFLVLKKLQKPDQALRIEAKSQCEVIADRLVAKLIADRFTLIDTLDLESFYMEPVGPIGDNRYGCIFLFTLEDYFEARA